MQIYRKTIINYFEQYDATSLHKKFFLDQSAIPIYKELHILCCSDYHTVVYPHISMCFGYV